MTTVYEYLSAETYLAGVWKFKKERNKQFSVRSWSKQLGMKFHAPLYQILIGKRKVPKHYLPLLIANLNLNANEAQYLETLVDLQRAKTEKEKELYTARLIQLSPKKRLEMVELDTYKYFKDPLHGILLEMTLLKDFVNDPVWIQKRIGFKVTLPDIFMTLDRLILLGFLEKSPEGKLVKTSKHLFSKSDIPNKHLQEYHIRCSDMAKNAIETQDVLEREFNASTFNLSKKNLPRAKELLRKYLNDFISEIESLEGEGEETYHLNLQLFKLTN